MKKILALLLLIPSLAFAQPIPPGGSGSGGDASAANQTTIIGHVDGLEALLGTIDADTGGILTAVQLLDNAISGNEIQADVLSSALPTGASTSANQATIIGHVDGLEGLLTTIDADTSLLATTVSGGNVRVSVQEAVEPTYARVAIDYASAQTATQIIAAQGASNRICVEQIVISNGATAGTIKIVENTGTPVDIIENIYVGINGGAVIPFNGTLCTSANVNLGITSTTVTTHSVTVTYRVKT